MDFLAEILSGMPEAEFEKINWVKKPAWEVFYKDIQTIARDMINAGENTLCLGKNNIG
ncbi:MAG: hypothetical protein LBO62_00150 [Endomicrobium sp.]|nr:hypothetical protein [Endomicrobium sp.]